MAMSLNCRPINKTLPEGFWTPGGGNGGTPCDETCNVLFKRLCFTKEPIGLKLSSSDNTYLAILFQENAGMMGQYYHNRDEDVICTKHPVYGTYTGHRDASSLEGISVVNGLPVTGGTGQNVTFYDLDRAKEYSIPCYNQFYAGVNRLNLVTFGSDVYMDSNGITTARYYELVSAENNCYMDITYSAYDNDFGLIYMASASGNSNTGIVCVKYLDGTVTAAVLPSGLKSGTLSYSAINYNYSTKPSFILCFDTGFVIGHAYRQGTEFYLLLLFTKYDLSFYTKAKLIKGVHSPYVYGFISETKLVTICPAVDDTLFMIPIDFSADESFEIEPVIVSTTDLSFTSSTFTANFEVISGFPEQDISLPYKYASFTETTTC